MRRRPTRKFRRIRRSAYDHGEPIRAIDTRPALVFFSLLAILMLLPASAMRTHALIIDLAPLDPDDHAFFSLPTDRVSVTSDDRIRWNSNFISAGTLATELKRSRFDEDPHRLIFEADGEASYDRVAKVLLIIKKSDRLDDRFCISGLAKHRDFGKPWRHIAMRLTIAVSPSTQIEPPDPETLECYPAGAGHLPDL